MRYQTCLFILQVLFMFTISITVIIKFVVVATMINFVLDLFFRMDHQAIAIPITICVIILFETNLIIITNVISFDVLQISINYLLLFLLMRLACILNFI